MQPFSRRGFVRMAGAACFTGAAHQVIPMSAQAADAYPIQLGLVVKVRKGETPAAVLARVRELGFSNCQMSFDAPSLDNAQPLKRAIAEQGVKVTAVMELGPGPKVWDFYHGPLTVGLIPPATRRARIDALKLAADVAQTAGV